MNSYSYQQNSQSASPFQRGQQIHIADGINPAMLSQQQQQQQQPNGSINPAQLLAGGGAINPQRLMNPNIGLGAHGFNGLGMGPMNSLGTVNPAAMLNGTQQSSPTSLSGPTINPTMLANAGSGSNLNPGAHNMNNMNTQSFNHLGSMSQLDLQMMQAKAMASRQSPMMAMGGMSNMNATMGK